MTLPHPEKILVRPAITPASSLRCDYVNLPAYASWRMNTLECKCQATIGLQLVVLARHHL